VVSQTGVRRRRGRFRGNVEGADPPSPLPRPSPLPPTHTPIPTLSPPHSHAPLGALRVSAPYRGESTVCAGLALFSSSLSHPSPLFSFLNVEPFLAPLRAACPHRLRQHRHNAASTPSPPCWSACLSKCAVRCASRFSPARSLSRIASCRATRFIGSSRRLLWGVGCCRPFRARALALAVRAGFRPACAGTVRHGRPPGPDRRRRCLDLPAIVIAGASDHSSDITHTHVRPLCQHGG